MHRLSEEDQNSEEQRNVHNELNMVGSEAGDLLYAGDKLVPPKSVRQELLNLTHTTHLGEDIIWSNVKKIWHWPSLKNDLNTMYEQCGTCQEEKRSKNKSKPVLPMDLLFFGPGEYLISD